jgi:hypothetical protein
MKISTAVICFVLLVVGALPMQAQDITRFNIPFDFTVGNKVLPAGTYIVTEALPNNPSSWRITNNMGSASMFITNPMSSPWVAHNVSLVFRHDGGQYSLAEFWQDSETGRKVIRPKTNTRIAQSKSETVEIAALQ